MELILFKLADLAVAVIVIIAAAVVPVLISRLLAKAGLQLDDARKAKMEKDIADVLLEVEERVESSKKAGYAVEKGAKEVIAIAEISKKFPKLEASAIPNLIKRVLPKIGLGASGPKFKVPTIRF